MINTGVKRIATLFFFACAVNAQGQPNEYNNIQGTIERFFEGFSKSDTNMVNEVIDKNMVLQTIIDKEGQPTRIRPESKSALLKSIAKMRDQKFEERIVNWDITIDGAYANAWCKYKVILDDTSFHHWGIDNFQMVKDNGSWRILSVTDTRRKPETYREEPDIDIAALAKLNPVKPRDELKKDIHDLMDRWHKAAATADEKIFFNSMDSSGIYLGTDKTENWTKQEFEQWSKKYFDQDKAWDFKPYDRHIYFSDDNRYAWFDELLDTWMGVCRGSGVLEYENGRYRIKHYNLAVTIPNERVKEFVKINKSK